VIKAPETNPEDDSYSLARALAESIRITFKFNSSIPLNSEDSKIKALCSILKATHGMNLRIVGHTDRLGSRKVNNKIGLQRAENVKQKFMKCGIPASRLKREAKLYSKSEYENGMLKRVVELIIE
jgi:outer membrane protein OmpA-like peptidoglycan-associated protein